MIKLPREDWYDMTTPANLTGQLTAGGVLYDVTGVPHATPPIKPPPNGLNPVPPRVAGCYWTDWNSLPLGHVPAAYNLIWLFAGVCDANGNVSFGGGLASETLAQFKTDLAAKRKAGVCCIMSVGGAGRTMPLTSRSNSTNFVNSVKSLNTSLGGLDGLDFDIENNAQINATELVWIGQQLKTAIPGFNITWAGANPLWITSGPPACEAMVAAGVLDMVAVMCYDWPASTEAAKIQASQNYINGWTGAVGAQRTCIGVQLPNADDGPDNTFGSTASVLSLWNWAFSAHQGIRGMDIWTAYEDARASGGSGGAFVSQVIPVVLASK